MTRAGSSRSSSPRSCFGIHCSNDIIDMDPGASMTRWAEIADVDPNRTIKPHRLIIVLRQDMPMTVFPSRIEVVE